MTRSLQQFVGEVNGTSHLRIEYDFGGGFVRLQTSEAERRQAQQDIRSSEDVLIELLRNARDAHAAHIFVATWREGSKRFIVVLDDGEGIPADMHEHIFEPRVTSKLDTAHIDKWGMHGRGMALYSIAVNAQDAHVAASEVGLGSSILVTTDTERLSEKSDQSTFPSFYAGEQGSVAVRGPRNMLRCACEFAIEERRSCSVYIGSPTEICATMFLYGLATLSAIDRVFCKDRETLPVVKRLAVSSDPASFSEIASSLGINISERSARRIMSDEISPVSSVLDQVTIEPMKAGSTKSARKNKKHAHQTIRAAALSSDDVHAVADAALKAFSEAAPRYYLSNDVEAHARQSRGKLIVSIPLVPDEEDF